MNDDDRVPFRGVVNGVLLSIPLWVIIIVIVSHVWNRLAA